MRFALMHEPQQGASYEDQLALARHAEAAGFEAIFRSDHYESFPGPADRPTTDAWAVLAGLARDTERIHLGALVSPVTYRRPGNIAKLATTIDDMSGGRLEVALGAGWHEEEHRAPRLPLPADRRPGDDARGAARDPRRAVEPARRLVVRGSVLLGDRCPPSGRGRAAGSTSSSAATALRARCGSRSAGPTSTT